VWSNPVLRSISIMMALINLVAATADSQLVLFARRALHATNSEIGGLIAAIAVGFAFSPIAHGDRYLAEAAKVGDVGDVGDVGEAAERRDR
jgi:hypothetical protein